ncbi:MAG: hypothetical protein HY687_00715 [Chloroflexi bacterium]|nr:hypothetical protein [Chloroflexota bacterium]
MPETTGPLLTLAGRLRALGPPSLTALRACLEGVEDYEAFRALVREELPGQEREVLGQPGPERQLEAFSHHFGERYFPLMEGVESYRHLLMGIPVVPLGFSWEDYHDQMNFRGGLQLMAYLLADPYAEGADGARVPLAEACAGLVPAGLLQRVPPGGFPREAVWSLLRDTLHQGLAHWADILAGDTGNYFLDLTYEGLEELPSWEPEVVGALTQEWRQAQELLDQVHALADWLEEKPPARFEELLDFIERRRDHGRQG